MAEITWNALQRLFDDEPSLKVWREEREFEIEALADRAGIAIERLADLSRATDAETDRLATALRVPLEYLVVPSSHAA